ncbi:MAG: aldehyde dehydrogenase family protein [Myxococcales bacterium]|nr:aldehyde dehydrogenase family protein [Myxococcales bacterium]
MLATQYPYYLAGRPVFPEQAGNTLPVADKTTGAIVSTVSLATTETIESAISAAVAALGTLRNLAAYERQQVLLHCVKRFEQRQDELAWALCVEAGKPIRDSRGEVTRLIDTFRIAAEESTRQTGEVLPLEISARARGYQGMWKRVPIGPCGFISPFNFPLNLVAHKIAPAIASGCPFVLKPASATPIGAILIGEILAETDLPEGSFSILPANRHSASILASDPRIRLLSFTGSPQVGWDLRSRAGNKKVTLELGGNAAVIVDSDAAIEDSAQRITFGAFYQSGQSCISVQRIFAHREIYESLKTTLVEKTKALVVGNPKDEATSIGPLISEEEAIRVEGWIQSAIGRGARVLCGGKRNGNMIAPTLLENVPTDEPIVCREVFGPVAVLAPYDDFDQALRMVNESDYGLQAGVFTNDIYKVHKAWDELEVGGVVIGDVPSWRVDHMPYGGVKHSGLGREGVRFAMEEMTEIRMLVIRDRYRK